MRWGIARGLVRAFSSAPVIEAAANAPSFDDVVARLHLVLHSNDSVARTITLRVLGSAAQLLRTRMTVHNTVLRSAIVAVLSLHCTHTHGDDSLPSCEAVNELCAALRASEQIAVYSPPFARTLFPVLLSILFGGDASKNSGPKLVGTDANVDAIHPVSNFRVRKACVHALGCSYRDVVLMGTASSVCFKVVGDKNEPLCVRCEAISTVSRIARKCALVCEDTLSSLRGVVLSASEDEIVSSCLAAASCLMREVLEKCPEDAEILAGIACNASWKSETRCKAVEVLSLFAEDAQNPYLVKSVSHVLDLCCADGTPKLLSETILRVLPAFINHSSCSSDLCSVFHDGLKNVLSKAAAVDILPSCSHIFCAVGFRDEWRSEILAMPIFGDEKARRSVVQFLYMCSRLNSDVLLRARGLVSAITLRDVPSSPASPDLVELATVAASSGIVEATESGVNALIDAGRFSDAYSVLRAAFCRGMYGVCAAHFPRLNKSLPLPFSSWLTVLSLVSRAEHSLQTQTQRAASPAMDDTTDADDARVDVVSTLLRAASELEASVQPVATCTVQVQLLRLRCAALSAPSASLVSVAKRYAALSTAHGVAPRSVRVLRDTACACCRAAGDAVPRALVEELGEAAIRACGGAVEACPYPPVFFAFRNLR